MVALSGTLAGFGAIPSRSQTADPRHGPTSDRKEAVGERFSMFSEFYFWVYLLPTNVHLPALLLPTPREDGGARCMSERRGQTDQIEGLSTSIAKNPVPSQTTTCPARRPTSL